jgi:hypothetical protein
MLMDQVEQQVSGQSPPKHWNWVTYFGTSMVLVKYFGGCTLLGVCLVMARCSEMWAKTLCPIHKVLRIVCLKVDIWVWK